MSGSYSFDNLFYLNFYILFSSIGYKGVLIYYHILYYIWLATNLLEISVQMIKIFLFIHINYVFTILRALEKIFIFFLEDSFVKKEFNHIHPLFQDN